jgi:glycosyltransferase involved in cell wall biosynthesis
MTEYKKRGLSVVIPVYYNSDSLQELYERLCTIPGLDYNSIDFEMVFVDDGSGDKSFEIIQSLSKNDDRISLIKLSKNFGSFVACLAGLSHSTGDCAVIISADLQDPPEMIVKMLKKWEEGNKVVMAVRDSRKEGILKIFFAQLFYKIFRLLISKEMPRKGFDFVLIDRQVIDVLTFIKEKNTTLMGLILWAGFKRAELPYTREERKHGKSRWTFFKKVNYFIDSIIAFSLLPVRIISLVGITISMLSFIGIGYVFFAYFMGLMNIAGWPSLMVIILFMFGNLFLSIGILGEYIWRNLEETRRRPLYIVDTCCNSKFKENNYN